jgi:hypothetical protein
VIGIGAGIGVRPTRLSAAPLVSSNLLQWTESFGNAAWVSNDLTLFQGTGNTPVGVVGYGSNADHAFDTATTAALRQTSAVAATNTNGASFSVLDVTTSWARYSVTFTFSSGAYVFSTYLKADDAGVGLRLKIDAVGGFIRCSYQDIGDVGEYYPWGAQLEPGSVPTAYQPRQV